MVGMGGCDATPPGFNQYMVYNPLPTSPFVKREKKEEPFLAVKLTKANLPSIVWDMLQHSGKAIIIPEGQDAVVLGSVRFDMGEWIVRVYDHAKVADSYRHATEEERKAYGLV